MGRVLAVIIWILTLLSVLMFVSGKWWFPDRHFRSCSSPRPPVHDHDMVVGISFTAAQIGLGWMVWKYRDTGKAGDRARLFARQQSSRGALDRDHRLCVYRARSDGPERLGFVALERCASGFLSRLKWSRNSFSGTSTTPAKTTN